MLKKTIPTDLFIATNLPTKGAPDPTITRNDALGWLKKHPELNPARVRVGETKMFSLYRQAEDSTAAQMEMGVRLSFEMKRGAAPDPLIELGNDLSTSYGRGFSWILGRHYPQVVELPSEGRRDSDFAQILQQVVAKAPKEVFVVHSNGPRAFTEISNGEESGVRLYCFTVETAFNREEQAIHFAEEMCRNFMKKL